MNNIEMKNIEIISSLVSKHFDLDVNSLKIFNKRLKNRRDFLDPSFDFLGEDLRFTINLKDDDLKAIDEGWNSFQSLFPKFCYEYDVNYQNFRTNKIRKDKQEMKMFKELKKHCNSLGHIEKKEIVRKSQIINNWSLSEEKVEEHLEQSVSLLIEKIGIKKIPNNERLKLVISANFSDWFLASTGEDWSSCLNLESDFEESYWAGLPGLIGDDNRLMFYITDDSKKTYCDITTDKFISRSWGILSSEEKIHIIKFYPNDFFGGKEIETICNGIVPLSFEEHHNWNSKNTLEILRTKDGLSNFIYQDHSGFIHDANINENGGFLLSGSRNCQFEAINTSGDIDEISLYNYTNGLKYLIKYGENISDFPVSTVYCENCGEILNSEDEQFYTPDNEGIYCENCFNENYFYCEGCGDSFPRSISYNEPNTGDLLCEECFFENNSYCDDCGDAINNDELHVSPANEDEYICENCYVNYPVCIKCDEHFDSNDLDENGMCASCAENDCLEETA